MKHPRPRDRGIVNVHAGDVYVSDAPEVIRTVLGTCISVCLRDPRRRIGGINHFMLARPGRIDDLTGRYGVHAMELLINACMKLGAYRYGLEAKVFGGGHVISGRSLVGEVARANIDFVLSFLDVERIPVAQQDVGGNVAREIYYYIETGRVLVRRWASSTTHAAGLTDLDREEAKAWRLASRPTPTEANVTLF